MKLVKTVLGMLPMLMALMAVSYICTAQAPRVALQRPLGSSSQEHLEGVKPTPDGGYIAVASMTGALNNGDIGNNGLIPQGYSLPAWVVKLDKDFRIEWQRIQVWPSPDFTITARDVLVTKDTGYVVIGNAYDRINANQFDIWVRKFDKKGKLLWSYQPVNNLHHDYLMSGVELSTGELVLAGYQTSGTTAAWYIKLSAQGELLWSKTLFTTAKARRFNDISVMPDGNLLMVGKKDPDDGNAFTDAYFVKTDTSGAVIWERTQGFFHNDEAWSAVYNSDNTITVGCTANSFGTPVTTGPAAGHHGGMDIYVVKLSADGNRIKHRFLGGSQTEDHPRLFRAADADRFYCVGSAQAVGGNITGNYGGTDIWLVHMDNEFNIVWEENYGGTEEDIHPFGFYADGNIVLAGCTNSNNNDVAGLHSGNLDVWLCKLGYLNRIAGYVYQDRNSNGVKDASEPFYTGGVVTSTRLRDNETISQIPANGRFNMTVDTGTYSTSFHSNNQSYTVNPASVQTSRSTHFNVDSALFGMIRVPGVKDLEVMLVPTTRARPGFKANYQVVVVNIGAEVIPAGNFARFIKDPLTAFSAFAPAATMNGDTARWTLPLLNAGDSAKYLIELELQPPPVLDIGDTLLLQANAILADDYDTADNHVVFKQVLTGAFDPNDKTEAHAGAIRVAEVLQEEYLTYVIRFQNMGNDTAFNITVKDTLSDKLNWSSIEIVRVSHPATVEISKGKIVNWIFNRIHLPAVSVNEPASHGYIIFRIKPKSTLLQGDVIQNSASIYFDYNLPVQTNVEETVVVGNSSFPVRLTQFEGVLGNGIVNLSWKTATEQHTKVFEVERSTDGVNFSRIGSVAAAGAPNGSAYAFKDLSPVNGYNYYRLKIIDEDGKYEHSTIVIINSKKPGKLTVRLAPNPSPNGVVSLNVHGAIKGAFRIDVVDMNGRNVMNKSLGNMTADGYSTTLNIGSLQKGIYFIRLAIGDELLTERIVLQ